LKKASSKLVNRQVRIMGFIIGDIYKDAHARTKYGYLYAALGRRFSLLSMQDASLYGIPRMVNALLTFHPNLDKWHERFYMNKAAFRGRSQKAAGVLKGMQGKVDLIFQDGSMFDAQWNDPSIPMVVYIDFTLKLALSHPMSASRFAYKGKELEQWLTLETDVYRKSAHIFTDSRMAKASIIRDYGIAPLKITVVGRGVNLEALPDIEKPPERATFNILFIGKNFYRKGGDLLLSAFRKVHQQFPHTRLIMITQRPETIVDQVGVEWVQPTWDRGEIQKWYRQADLFVLPSRLETFGDVLLEAMAFGLPCIGVDRDAMPEIIENEKTGFIIPADDIPALAAAIRRLVDQPELGIKLGRNARRRVEKHFTWDQVIAIMAAQIETVVFQKEEI
jgi:glycosyltransferase involved in cell wall biosynthesis